MTKNMFGSHYLHNLKINLVAVMANIEGDAHLNLFFQKGLSFNYENHQENFKEIISNDVTPFGLHNKMTAAIGTVNEEFHMKWYSILKNADKQLNELN